MKPNFKLFFALLVAALLATTGLILYKELTPEWRHYQRVYFQQESAKVIKDLAGADGVRRKTLQKRLGHLRHPDYRIRQILLDDGQRADRCVTCHLDLERLRRTHHQSRRFPFARYGCTICHGGVGRATEKSRAHSTLRIPRRPIFEYLQARKSTASPIDLFNFRADGLPIPTTGSTLCLRCHLGSHPRHVSRWRHLKFQPLDKVRRKLAALQREGLKLSLAQCLACHTTGYNPENGTFREDRVTCESCHGPGAFYADLMAGGRARDGAALALANVAETRADRVCLNCHRPERHDSYLGEDGAPVVSAVYLQDAAVPVLDGQMGDAAWNLAAATKVTTWQLGNGAPRTGADVVVRAVFDDARIYFMLQWSDASRQVSMGRWVRRQSQWQTETVWPDALAMHWPINEKVVDFKQGGCAVLCHTTGRFAAFPRMVTRQDGAIVDEWYWNAFAAGQAGRPGDGFVDHQVIFIPPGTTVPQFRWGRPGQSAAHGNDTSGARVPDTLGGIPLKINVRQDKGHAVEPDFRLDQGRPVPMHRARPDSADQILPLYVAGQPEKGDSAHIDGRAMWLKGYWTLEIGRDLRTDSARDVQFNFSQHLVTFGLALWNGSVGDRHQVATRIRLRLIKPLDSGA